MEKPRHNSILEDQKFNKIKTILVKEFSPIELFLFGSRASGTVNTNSDWDLCLIVEDSELSFRDRQIKALNALGDCSYQVDVFIYTQKEFLDWKNEFSSIPEVVSSTGLKVL